ncbi:hypothetical protein GCM10025865_03390 [Paraoerskovia sediminicola]|uniref:DUF1003 domain-containing protein n=1 Tax=Paraoerskovia sediminicola TaxID=1138587 RepID=A0ABN6XB92_9CELL|nr:DUF1003 domain-containing protein [Paraoerskovia sediminicola]BDZ41040.1 hypothetical protein GCM10025865_03390 [Paraoerskovia sediminicola]
MADRLDQPRNPRRSIIPRLNFGGTDAFGKLSESIARFMGTPRFILYLTLFCIVWLVWNSWGPESLRFDQAKNGFTALTLMLSLQASYAAPLILLAQNRQTDRDRVQAEQDRQRAERNLADTEYLAREMASLRIAVSEVATRDFLRSEMRNLLEELEEQREAEQRAEDERRAEKRKAQKRKAALRQAERRETERREAEERESEKRETESREVGDRAGDEVEG